MFGMFEGERVQITHLETPPAGGVFPTTAMCWIEYTSPLNAPPVGTRKLVAFKDVAI